MSGRGLADGAEHLDDQHAVVGDDGPAALADDVRVRHLLRVADVGDVINDVVGVFLQRVVGRTVEGRPAAVVIHAQPAAHVEVFDGEAHLVELGVKARRLLHRLLHRENVRHLRADVEMEQLEAMPQVLRLQHVASPPAISAVLRPNLAFSPAALGPLARALAQQPRADADQRLDAQLLGDRDDLAQLLQLLDHHDDLLAQLRCRAAPS